MHSNLQSGFTHVSCALLGQSGLSKIIQILEKAKKGLEPQPLTKRKRKRKGQDANWDYHATVITYVFMERSRLIEFFLRHGVYPGRDHY